MCYLAQLDRKYFVIKDHWVRDFDQGGRIHDPKMIYKARRIEYVIDIEGVPKLNNAWIVKVKEGVLLDIMGRSTME